MAIVVLIISLVYLSKMESRISIYDYELDVIDKIENNRNIWIKKASGIGATELILRYLTWKILVNNDLEYKNIFIVQGTYQQHANDVKVRMENLFRKKFPSMQLESSLLIYGLKIQISKYFLQGEMLKILEDILMFPICLLTKPITLNLQLIQNYYTR